MKKSIAERSRFESDLTSYKFRRTSAGTSLNEVQGMTVMEAVKTFNGLDTEETESLLPENPSDDCRVTAIGEIFRDSRGREYCRQYFWFESKKSWARTYCPIAQSIGKTLVAICN